MKYLVAFLACIALVAATAPLLNIDSKNVIPDRYLVVFHKNSTREIRDLHVEELKQKRFALRHERIINVFTIGDFIGYSAVLSQETLVQELKHPNVQYIEADQRVHLAEDTTSQTPATWGIDRIDQQQLPLENRFTYWNSAGQGVTAYVVDTGVYYAHSEFGTRASFGYNAVEDETDVDGNGHGTHVAGTIGGTIYGVAKKVKIVAVKVLDSAGSGTLAGVAAGIDWVTSDHRARGTSARSVANLSLGGGASTALDSAVENSVAAGVHYAVAAGNNNYDACYYSPARTPSAITVGATTNLDARASFSNYGTCVDIFAPGNGITSAWIGGASAISTISGTSMAAPHVAGAIALYLGHLVADGDNRIRTPAEVATYLTATTGTKGVISGVGTGSPNTFLYTGA